VSYSSERTVSETYISNVVLMVLRVRIVTTFWSDMQHQWIIYYRRFGTVYQSHLKLRNIPVHRRSQPPREESSKYVKNIYILLYVFFWVIPRRLNFICRRFGTLSVPSSYNIQTPGNYPEENIQHTEHGESLKSRIFTFN
jgi:hypothetical protein